MTERLINLKEVQHLTSLSRSRLYQLIKQRDFPSPIKIGIRRVAWTKSEVTKWIEQKIYESKHEGDAF